MCAPANKFVTTHATHTHRQRHTHTGICINILVLFRPDPTSRSDGRWQTGGRVWRDLALGSVRFSSVGFSLVRPGSVRFGSQGKRVWSYLKFLVVTFLSTISFRLNSLPACLPVFHFFSFLFCFSFFFQRFFYFLVFCFEMHVINSFQCAASPSRVGVKKYQNITSNKCWIRQAKGPPRPDPTSLDTAWTRLVPPAVVAPCYTSPASHRLVTPFPKSFIQLVTTSQRQLC